LLHKQSACWPEYDKISMGFNVFSPDSRHFAYEAMEGDYGSKEGVKWLAILDGKPVLKSGHDSVSFISFSQDSKHLAYVAGKGKKQCIILDGIAEKLYDRVEQPVFSPNGKSLAYIAVSIDPERGKEQQFIVLNGKQGKVYDSVNKPIFSSDSEHIAYSAIKGDMRMMVVDDKEGPRYEMQLPILFYEFGPKDNRLMYVVLKDNKEVVVVDHQEYPGYDFLLNNISLSADGESIAYAARKGDKVVIVYNGREGPEYDGIAPKGPVFSPDGENLLYVVSKDYKWFLVLNGEPIECDYKIFGDILMFSPDGSHFVYSALKDDKWFMVIDSSVSSPPYDHVSKPVFKADGIEYMAGRDGAIFRCRQIFNENGESKILEEEIGKVP
jgi:Tol biopolymer transport system component